MLTFREQASLAGVHVLAEKPAVAEVVVALDELNAVALGQTELIGAPSDEVVNGEQQRTRMGVLLGPSTRPRGHHGSPPCKCAPRGRGRG